MTHQSDVGQIPLSSTGIHISPMGIGTWAWGDTWFWQYGKGGYSDADLEAAYQASLAYGVTLFDTAEMYGFGQSERLLGQFARRAGWPAVIATKFFPLPWRLSHASFRDALRRSLDRMDLPCVDLYQMHWPFPPVSIDHWMDAMAGAVQGGLVRAVGVSNYNVAQTRRAHASLAQRDIPLASNQVSYSLLDRSPETNGLLALCKQLDVTVIAYSPLAQGLLTGKYTAQNPPPGIRGLRYRQVLSRIQPLIDELAAIGQKYGGKTPAQVALNWTIAKGTVPIPGAKTARQAIDNAGALGWHLTDAEVAGLDFAAREVGA